MEFKRWKTKNLLIIEYPVIDTIKMLVKLCSKYNILKYNGDSDILSVIYGYK